MAESNPNTNPQQETPAGGTEQTFTQAQLDEIVGKRVARAMKGMPSEAELGEFRSWKNGKDKDALAAVTKERDDNKAALDAANATIQKYEHEKLLLSKGVPADDIDYVEFKVNKLVNDKTSFEQAAESYLKENKPSRVRIDMSAPLGGGDGGKTTANDVMNALIRGARK